MPREPAGWLAAQGEIVLDLAADDERVGAVPRRRGIGRRSYEKPTVAVDHALRAASSEIAPTYDGSTGVNVGVGSIELFRLLCGPENLDMCGIVGFVCARGASPPILVVCTTLLPRLPTEGRTNPACMRQRVSDSASLD